MRVVIAGGGSVGRFIGQELQGAGHDVLIMDNDPGVVKRAQLEGEPKGVAWVRADACEVSKLTEARVSDADVVAAVTGDDEDNLVICQLAKRRFNVPRAVARINNPNNERIFRLLGIDATVSSTDVILSVIEQEIPSEALIPRVRLRHADVEVVEAILPQGSPLAGMPLRNLDLPPESIVAIVIRDGEPIFPVGGTTLEPGDELIALTRSTHEEELRQALFAMR